MRCRSDGARGAREKSEEIFKWEGVDFGVVVTDSSDRSGWSGPVASLSHVIKVHFEHTPRPPAPRTGDICTLSVVDKFGVIRNVS